MATASGEGEAGVRQCMSASHAEEAARQAAHDQRGAMHSADDHPLAGLPQPPPSEEATVVPTAWY